MTRLPIMLERKRPDLGGAGRYGEMWRDMGRYGEIWGDLGVAHHVGAEEARLALDELLDARWLGKCLRATRAALAAVDEARHRLAQLVPSHEQLLVGRDLLRVRARVRVGVRVGVGVRARAGVGVGAGVRARGSSLVETSRPPMRTGTAGDSPGSGSGWGSGSG